MRKIQIFLLALVVVLSLSPVANAYAVPEARDDCSIEVIVRYEGENVEGGTLSAIKVGCVAEEDGNYCFYQEKTGLKLEDVASSTAPAQQAAFYEDNKEHYDFHIQTQTVEDGKTTFTGLSTGLYLIVQEQPAAGFTKLTPFLVSVPYLENDEYHYHVTASIKNELEREEKPTDPPPTEPEDPKLPQTGQLNWPIPLMVVAGLAFFTLGWALCFGKKRESYES